MSNKLRKLGLEKLVALFFMITGIGGLVISLIKNSDSGVIGFGVGIVLILLYYKTLNKKDVKDDDKR